MADATPELTDDQKHRKAYGAATQRLREAHKDEFQNYMKDEASKLGLDWSPRKTAEDRAREELRATLAKYPHLIDEVSVPQAEQPATKSEPGL